MDDYYRPCHFCTSRPVYYCFRSLGHAIFVQALYSVLNARFRPVGHPYVLTFVLFHIF